MGFWKIVGIAIQVATALLRGHDLGFYDQGGNPIAPAQLPKHIASRPKR